MSTFIAWILGVIAFLIVLAFSIGLHEAGHLIAAKKFNLSVPKFFIGFGPKLWSKKTKETEYGVRLIPLGGFVSIEDDSQKDNKYYRIFLSKVAPWKRTVIFLAGPLVNIFLGISIILATLLSFPSIIGTTSIESVNECVKSSDNIKVNCSAEKAGLSNGDTITHIDGVAITSSDEFEPLFEGKDSVLITYTRDGRTLETTANLTEGLLGITLETETRKRTINESFDYINQLIYRNLEVIASMPSKVPNVVDTIFGGEKNDDSPSSVIAVGKTYGDVSANFEISNDSKVQTLLMYSGLLNLGLGLINLLPIMPLDGGRILIAFFDSIKNIWSKIIRKDHIPVEEETVQALTALTGTFVFGFMFLVILSDIVLIARGQL